jgi:hypothetical protein
MEIEKIEGLIENILSKEFSSDFLKQKIYKSGNRFNFSCPYCGDSKDARKKRGNFYLDTLAYKCYNGGCGIFKDSISFFKDFGVLNKLNKDDIAEIETVLNENRNKRRTIYGNIDITYFFDTDISDVLIPRDFFMKRLGLSEVGGSKIQRYISRRNQKPDERFAWDQRKEKLFLFNLTPDLKIIGLQVRNMNSFHGSSKYLTYKLSGIYQKLLDIQEPEIIEKAKTVDPISHVFGIGTLDFSLPVTIFEGPMDSWFWKNSVGLCSLENRFPFEIDNIQFWYDWDQAGKQKSMELLSEGFTVFNWGAFLEENNITKNKKWDLNDLVVHLRSTGKKIQRFEKYFTNDVLDIRYFIDQ